MSPTLLDRLPWTYRTDVPMFAENERLVRAMHKHWMAYMPLAAVIFPLAIVTGLLWAGLAQPASSWFGTASLVASMMLSIITLHWFFHGLLSLHLEDIFITDRRILALSSRLLLRDEMHEILLGEIKAVQVLKRGMLQNLLDYGHLWFDTGGSAADDTRQIISHVPHPYHWAKEITAITASTKGTR